MIKQFGDIEGLIKNVNDIKQEKRKKTIQESKEDIRISLELVKLDKNVKLPISIEKIIPYKKIQNSSEDINKFLLEQGFKATIQRLENNPFINKNIDESVNIKEKTKIKYITITSIDKFNSIIDEISKIGICAIDIETDSLDIEKANLVGFHYAIMKILHIIFQLTTKTFLIK